MIVVDRASLWLSTGLLTSLCRLQLCQMLFLNVCLIVCDTLRPKAVISRSEQNPYSWRLRTLRTGSGENAGRGGATGLRGYSLQVIMGAAKAVCSARLCARRVLCFHTLKLNVC